VARQGIGDHAPVEWHTALNAVSLPDADASYRSTSVTPSAAASTDRPSLGAISFRDVNTPHALRIAQETLTRISFRDLRTDHHRPPRSVKQCHDHESCRKDEDE
jgi:hypothetical protein